jgi:hypothetical protein
MRRRMLQQMNAGEEPGFIQQYQDVLDYAIAEGYTLPSSSVQELQNQMVIDLKAEGIWGKLKSFAVFCGDGDSDFATIDWINLIDMSKIGGLTYTVNQGFTGNGSNARIGTGFVINNEFTSLDSMSFGGYEFTNIDTLEVLFSESQGGTSAGNRLILITRTSNQLGSRFGTGTYTQSASNQNSIGFYHLDRFSATQYSQIKNGDILRTITNTVSGFNNGEIDLLAWSRSIFSQRGISLFFAAESLFDERVAFNDIIQDYIDSI